MNMDFSDNCDMDKFLKEVNGKRKAKDSDGDSDMKKESSLKDTLDDLKDHLKNLDKRII